MQIHIKAINSKMGKLKLPKPSNALQFRRNEVARLASGRSYTITLLPKANTPWISIEVIDGKKKKNIVEIFDAASTKCQCSCADFIEDQSGTCLHIATINNVRTNQLLFYGMDPGIKTFHSLYLQRVLLLPYNLTGYKNAKFTYFNASTFRVESYGGNLPGAVDSVAVKTLRQIQATPLPTNVSNPESLEEIEPDSAGLLNGVNLYDYQEIVFTKMVKARRAICSMKMGAGKTLVSIGCYAWMRRNEKPNARLLIICPKSLRLQWEGEIKRALGLTSIQVAKPEDLSKPDDIFITTYQYYTRHVDEFAKYSFDCVVADEIQFVKNADTKTWKAINKVKSDCFYGLSGTVIENRLDDLFSIMEIIDPGYLGPKWKFDDMYQNLLILTNTKILYKGIKNVKALQNELKDRVFSYDNLVLPPITYTTIDTVLSKTERASHDGYMEEARKLIAKSLSGPVSMGERMMIQAFLLKARQSCNGEELLTKSKNNRLSSKVQQFIKLVNDVCVKQNEKLVVFSEWTQMLDICKRDLNGLVGFTTYTGKETPKQRVAAVTKFQTDPDCKIFFSSDAGGVGLDGLQLAACNIVHLELPWNPSKLDQRTGRVYRLLQTKPVSCWYLVSDGPIELQIAGLLTSKREIRELTLKELV